jgi:hypothetical protein
LELRDIFSALRPEEIFCQEMKSRIVVAQAAKPASALKKQTTRQTMKLLTDVTQPPVFWYGGLGETAGKHG